MDKKEILFIDTNYNELFRLKDGGEITITRRTGETHHCRCFYLNEKEAMIDGVTYNVSHFIQMLEDIGSTVKPKDLIEYKLEQVEQSEFRFMFAKEVENENRGCIGHLRADFDTGKAFFSTWWPENENLRTQEFKDEFEKVINYFRKEAYFSLLKSRSDMYNVCSVLRPTKYEGNSDISGFKVVTDKHTYYFRCNPRLGEYNLYAYCYNNQELNRYRNKMFVEQNFDAVFQDKFFKTEYGFEEIYFNPDSTAGGQLVYNEFSFELIREASKQDSIEKFFDYLNSNCKQSLMDIDSPEFMDYLKEFMEQDADYLKDDKETANAMIKAANEDKKQSKTEPER